MPDMKEGIFRVLADRIKEAEEDKYTTCPEGTLWVSTDEADRQYRQKIYSEWKQMGTQIKDPVQVLREEMNTQLTEIRTAIRKLGILLDSDAPTPEQLEKHKALKEAYLKYKMIEKLVLGEDSKGNESQR